MSINATQCGTRGEINTGSAVSTGGGTSSATGGGFAIFLVWWPAANGGADPVSGYPQDNKGNTYALAGSIQTTASGDLSCGWYVCQSGAGGSGHIATCDFSNAGAFASIYLFSITGQQASSPLDIHVGNANTGFPYTITGATLANANEVLLAGYAVDTGNNSGDGLWSISNMTLVDSDNAPATYWPTAVASLVVSSTTAVNPAFTYDAGGSPHASVGSLISFIQGGAVTGVAWWT